MRALHQCADRLVGGGRRAVADLSGVVKAYDIRGVVGEQLDTAIVCDLGAAFAQLVAGPDGSAGRQAVVVGYDMRESSLASTDMLYFASGWLDLPGAMFTASHNPARYNGIKLCRAAATRSARTAGCTRSGLRSSAASSQDRAAVW